MLDREKAFEIMYGLFWVGFAEDIWIVKGIIESTKEENVIINISAGPYMLKTEKYWEGSKNNSAEIKAYRKAIDYAKKKRIIVVSAIGNASVNIDKNSELLNVLNNGLKDEGKFAKGIVQDILSQLPHVISVASTGPKQTVASFSNYRRNAIDFTVPGGDIELLNMYGPEKWMEDELFKKGMILVAHPQGGYYFNYGNSLAAPKVSAALALIIDKYGYKKNPNKAIQHLKRNSNENNEIDLYKSLQK